MGSFTLTDCKFIYTDQEKTQVLLNLNDFLSNKSRISLHRLPEQEHPVLSDLLLRLLKKVTHDAEEMALPVIMIDTLMAAHLIRSSQPFHVLEYGCQEGLLSSHIAELLGTFHEESSLVCAYNTLDFASLTWMERMADIDRLPKLSYFAGDYGHLQLPKHYYDIVIINGSVNYTNPPQILSDSLELVTEDGILLCYVDNTPFLESTFKLFFEEREEYELSAFQKIFLANAKDKIELTEEKPDFAGQVQQHLNEAADIFSNKQQNKERINELAETLNHDCQIAAAQGNIDLKIQLLEQKERLLSYLVKLMYENP